MSRQMDARTLELEANLNALYSQAVDEVRAEFARFTADFEAEDRRQSARVTEGEITPEEYARWRQNNIIRSDRYQATVDSLTTMLVNTDVAAMEITRGQLPIATAESYNFVQALGSAAAEDAGLSMGTFQIYNADSVQAILRDNRELLPHVDVEEDQRWNHDRINREILTGILTGDSIPKIADRLQGVTNMDRNAAVRNARTAMTGAENLGRRESADRLRAQGLPMKEVWSATYDSRTRDTHLMLDGTEADANGLFGVGILTTPLRYPGDPLGDPGEVYNCRCRLNVQIGTIDHSNDADLYEQFMRDNHPEEYEALQDKRDERQEAAERREALLAERIQEPEQPAIEYRGHIDDGIRYVTQNGNLTRDGAAAMAEDLGIDRRTAREYASAVNEYSGSEFREIRAASIGDLDAVRELQTRYGETVDVDRVAQQAENIQAFIDASPKWDGGQLSRGVWVSNEEDLAAMIQSAQNGQAIDMGGISSWTSDESIAAKFARTYSVDLPEGIARETGRSVVLITNETSTDLGTSIRHLSGMRSEQEVLVGSQAGFIPTAVEERREAVYIYGDIRRIER